MREAGKCREGREGHVFLLRPASVESDSRQFSRQSTLGQAGEGNCFDVRLNSAYLYTFLLENCILFGCRPDEAVFVENYCR